MRFDLGTSYDQNTASTGIVDEEALEAEIGRSTLINLFEATLLGGCSPRYFGCAHLSK